MFFTHKIPLNEFFPKEFVDIHSHLLPGIDDGAKSMDESLDLIQGLIQMGFTRLITTPHIYGSVWPNTPEIIRSKAMLLQEEIQSRKLPVSLSFAAEYMLDEKFMQYLDTSSLLTIKNKYVLIEFPNFQAPLQLHAILFKLNSMGYEPILAHPERYTYFENTLNQIEELKEIGCLFQLNLLSLAKHYGTNVYETAIKLLKAGVIDFVGTDAHRKYHLETLKKITSKKHRKLLEIPFQNNLNLW